MSIENEFKFIGWNTEGNSDKIWGYFLRPGHTGNTSRWEPEHNRNCCIFWGRRGKAMQFKADIVGYELEKLVRSKLNKGYLKIDQNKLLNIWPTFITEAEAKLMWDVLAGRVK
jgi:hypothetical protein